MKSLKIVLAATFMASAATFTVSLPGTVMAHEGKLDSMGCHYARNNRNYHCHEGRLEGKTFRSRAEAIRNYNRLKDADDNDDDDGGGL